MDKDKLECFICYFAIIIELIICLVLAGGLAFISYNSFIGAMNDVAPLFSKIFIGAIFWIVILSCAYIIIEIFVKFWEIISSMKNEKEAYIDED